MENKYFTPSIEDIRVGYECEWLGAKGLKHNFIPIIMDLDWINIAINSGIQFFRTPYLTKEQIRSEGWIVKYPTSSGIGGQTLQSRLQYKFFIEKDNYMGLILNDDRLEIIMKDVLLDDRTERTSNGRLYLGECKDINTFRQICKLLNIK